jgi:hypothetical protein
MSGLMNVLYVAVFAGASVASVGAIVGTVAPQWDRITRLIAQGAAA